MLLLFFGGDRLCPPTPSSHWTRNRQCTRWLCVRYALRFKHPPHVHSRSITFDVLAYAVLRADVTAARKGRFASGRRRQRRNYKVAASRDVAVIKKFLTHYVKRTKTRNSRAVPARLPAPAASARVYNYVDETISLYVVPVVYTYTRVSRDTSTGHCCHRENVAKRVLPRCRIITSTVTTTTTMTPPMVYAWTNPTFSRGQYRFAPLWGVSLGETKVDLNFEFVILAFQRRKIWTCRSGVAETYSVRAGFRFFVVIRQSL